MHINYKKLLQYFTLFLFLTISVSAQEQRNVSNSYSFDSKITSTKVYWGDTHLHTNLSFDAYFYGNTVLGLNEAYRFAKGETIMVNSSQKRLQRPLDFLVIADHAQAMGVLNALDNNNQEISNTKRGRHWSSLWKKVQQENNKWRNGKFDQELMYDFYAKPSLGNRKFRDSVWHEVTEAADKYNDPGKFTAFIGFEWTVPFHNLHRVVVFKDGSQKADQILPFTQYDSADPEDLWNYMTEYEANTGGKMLAIPHNSNLSKGVMFALVDANGQPFSKQYAELRSRWEPLVEVTQLKGDSETHPFNSPTDEFADFQTVTLKPAVSFVDEIKKQRNITVFDDWVKDNNQQGNPDWMRQYEYARSALKLGLDQQAKLGVNPFKFGMIGSTDQHSSLSTAGDNIINRTVAEAKLDLFEDGVEVGPIGSNSGGFAAVWAEENTRVALFTAMQRKEVYATTGPRMTVRFFGGWNFTTNDALRPNLAEIGYQKGVPMGGDLTQGPEGKSPSFLVRAVKDPLGANLDRIQIIKGWHSNEGQLHEKIYNIALSDGRRLDKSGKAPTVGSSVNKSYTAYVNSIGDPELAVVWTDPDFNQNELAFYYVRVLEIPTPRRVTYDTEFFGRNIVDTPHYLQGVLDSTSLLTIQERAYTSPIWYTPTRSMTN